MAILDVCVVWHPDDHHGATVAEWLLDHFHGTAYSGLIGGTIEVYTRSLPWADGSDAPRILPFQDSTPASLPAPRYSVAIPVVGVHLLRSIGDAASAWRSYLDALVDAAQRDERVGVLPLRLPGRDDSPSGPLDRYQAMDPAAADDPSVLCREVAQQVTQMVSGGTMDRLTICCSRTKEAFHAGGHGGSRRHRAAGTQPDRQHPSGGLRGRDRPSAWQRLASRPRSCCGFKQSSWPYVPDVYAGRDWCQREMLAKPSRAIGPSSCFTPSATLPSAAPS